VLTWSKRESWLAVFDVLGFKNLIREADQDFPGALLTRAIEELLETLDSPEKEYGNLDYLVFSDTVVLFAPSLTPSAYPWFLLQCKNLIKDSIRIQLPLRGAISAGTMITATEHPILLGPAFVEAYEYCEDQDWIGLILAPSATRALRSSGLEPLRHHFVAGDVPLRKRRSEDVVAYRFQDGSCNFDSPLIPWLREMRARAPEHAKDKYERTIEHIKRHYQRCDD
jgi:hypothetical protein